MYEDMHEQNNSKGYNMVSLHDKYVLKLVSLFGEIEGIRLIISGQTTAETRHSDKGYTSRIYGFYSLLFRK